MDEKVSIREQWVVKKAWAGELPPLRNKKTKKHTEALETMGKN